MAENPEAAQRQTEARAAVLATLESVASSYDADRESRATILSEAGDSVTKQDEELRRSTRALANQTDELETLLATTTKAMNEFGDLQNWAEIIERDLLVVEETMRIVEGKPESENISGT